MNLSRDDFSEGTKRDLALRASHICSICKRSTSGPGDAHPSAVTKIGVAAHICAAAQGGPRYDTNMTSEQRRNILNGIWLCSSCSVLIDRDEHRYSVTELHRLKSEHEASRRINGTHQIDSANIIAIGPNIIAVGHVISCSQSGFRVRVEHFVEGTGKELLRYADEYPHCVAGKRYIVISELGYGGLLAGRPSVIRNGASYEIEFRFADRVPRHDATRRIVAICTKTGRLIEGIDALIQNFEETLGTVRGEWFADLEFGSYLADFYWRYHGSPWFEALAKMEIARLCSVSISNNETTPLLSVNRVDRVHVPTFNLESQRLRVEVEFDIEGIGFWKGELAIFIASPEQIVEGQERGARYVSQIKRLEEDSRR